MEFVNFANPFMIEALFTLAMLILLQAVLGFDNLLYISIESKRVTPDRQSYVRRVGIAIAIGLRIILLFAIAQALPYLQDVLFEFKGVPWDAITGKVNAHSLIVLLGGAFIIYTAFKEIYHMLSVEDIENHGPRAKRSVGGALFWIVAMNLVFSFDSILSALALTKNFWVMAAAIVVSGLLMILLADRVADFLKRNRAYEVLGLFILFIVGIMLVSEGGELAHIKLFGTEVTALSKSTFYFVLIVLIAVDIVQSRYRGKLAAQRQAELKS